MTTAIPDANEKAVQPFNQPNAIQSAELSAIALAAAAKAEVEAAWKMAIQAPRNEADARQKIIDTCKLPAFAKKAKYRKPVGKKFDEQTNTWRQEYAIGPSIRFAEAALRHWRNVFVQQGTIYDDDTKRVIKIAVRDLEANVTFSKELTLEKSVERRDNRGREVLGQRLNTDQKTVYRVRATEDELLTKENANASKIIRVNGLRVIPQYIVDEAMAEVDKIVASGIKEDPNKERKDLSDGFYRLGVLPSALEGFFKVPLLQFTVAQLQEAREMLTSIEEGHATWREYIEGTQEDIRQEMSENSQRDTKGKEVAAQLEKVSGERGVEVAMPPATPVSVPQAVPEQASLQPAISQNEAQGTNTQEDQETFKEAIATAEFVLKNTATGQKKYYSVLSVMKVRLTGNQMPMDVLPKEQWQFYLAQLQRAITTLKTPL